jgi:hypothetical protein
MNQHVGSPTSAAQYLEPPLAAGLVHHEVPVVDATPTTLGRLGVLVDHPEGFEVPIVPWPVAGWRALDPGTGIDAGTTEGTFSVWWEGETLLGRNEAVGGSYVLGWSTSPDLASRGPTPLEVPERVLIWHANYHPDGGQLFVPWTEEPYIVLLAPAGDDVAPRDFVGYRVSGGRGICISPGVWHDAVFPQQPSASFQSIQGKVHARVSSNIAREFGVLLSLPLRA